MSIESFSPSILWFSKKGVIPAKAGIQYFQGPERTLWGLVYLDYFGKMVQYQVSKCSLFVPSTDGRRRRRGIEMMKIEVAYTTVAVDE